MSDLIKRFKGPVLFFVSGSLLQRHLLTFCINSIFHFLKNRKCSFLFVKVLQTPSSSSPPDSCLSRNICLAGLIFLRGSPASARPVTSRAKPILIWPNEA